MAIGDITVFDEALDYMFDGSFAGTDDIKCAILDNTATPIASFATPALADFTQVGSAGSYNDGGESLGNLASMVSEAGGTLKFDSATNPTWPLDALNDVDAFWGLIYNDTDAGNRGIAFVELAGPVDMQVSDLTITWPGAGIFTIARP